MTQGRVMPFFVYNVDKLQFFEQIKINEKINEKD